MTIDEAKGNLIHAIRWNDMPKKEALEMAIKALELQPCEDCISRQSVLEEAFEVDTKEYGRIEVVGVDAINSLPPVTPQSKTGYWRHYEGMLTCSECRAEFYDDIMEYCGDDVPKCCPDCGARMIKPNMSEIPIGSKPEISSYYGLKSYVRKRSDNDEN